MVDAVMEAVRRNSGGEETTGQQLLDLRAGLAQLQDRLGKLAISQRTAKEVIEFSQGLQELACEVGPTYDQAEAFLAAIEEAGLKEDPAFKDELPAAEKYVAYVRRNTGLLQNVGQVKLFLAMEKVAAFNDLGTALDKLVDQKLAFKARRDPFVPLQPTTIVIRKNGNEFVYLPERNSVISQRCWEHVIAARDRCLKTGAEFRQSIVEQLKAFASEATDGLNPYKAVQDEEEGIIFLSTSFRDNSTSRWRRARMLLRVGRGNFMVHKVFGPDKVEFLLRASVFPDQNPRWFPIDPKRFDPGRVPPAIADIVFSAIQGWYDSLALQAKGEIPPTVLLSPGADCVGKLCTVFIHNAYTARHGPDTLTLAVRRVSKGIICLEEYVSRNNIFNFDALRGQEVPLEESEQEEEVPPDWVQVFIQARIIRGFLDLAASRQRSAEIMGLKETLTPLITIQEALGGKTGHSVFHNPKAQTGRYGPAHVTCHIKWNRKTFVLQGVISWVSPGIRSGGALFLNELVGVTIPRQPVEDETPAIQVLRGLLVDRMDYETLKASQEEAAEEEGNGAPSNENES